MGGESMKAGPAGIMLTNDGQPFAKQSEYPTQAAFLTAVGVDWGDYYGDLDEAKVTEIWAAWRVGLDWLGDDGMGYALTPIDWAKPRGATPCWLLGELEL